MASEIQLKDITVMDLSNPRTLTMLEQLQIVRYAAGCGTFNTGETQLEKLKKVNQLLDQVIQNWIHGRYLDLKKENDQF